MRVNTILLSAEKDVDEDTEAKSAEACAAQLGITQIVLSYDF